MSCFSLCGCGVENLATVLSGSRSVSGNQPVFLVLGILSSESNSPATHRIPNPSPMRLVSYMWVVGLKKSFPRWGGGGGGGGAGAGHDLALWLWLWWWLWGLGPLT
ncbi:hypothetical protein SAY87_013029 [Trapa incisa]|uniref:Uncharacterized protein n=1 Tax=Trapa incisa TaxID=236973 RepID=A0AAN7QCA8_9MYRT|nr:hypothetical protein SAY87_013029 [Trapa incisa]